MWHVYGATPGDLVFTSDEDIVTLKNIYFVKATPAITSVGNAVLSDRKNIYDVVLADERILWSYKIMTADYNTYKSDRHERVVVGEEDDYLLENLNADVEWTWAEIIIDIETALALAVPFLRLNFTWPVRSPRNVVAKGRSAPEVLQYLLEECHAYLAADFSQAGTPVYYICPVGGVEDEVEVAALEGAKSSRLIRGEQVYINPYCMKSAVANVLFSQDPTLASGVREESYQGADKIGGTGTKSIPSPYAVYRNESGDILNQGLLEAWGNEIAGEYKSSFANTWRDASFAGILNWHLGRTFHEITWQSTSAGAFTRIRSFRPHEDVKTATAWDRLFAHGDYLIPECKGVRFFKVEAIKTSAGGAWTDFATHGFPAYLAGKACKSDGSGLASATSYLVASTAPTAAPSGVIPAINAIVGWLPGDGLPNMPGITPATPVAGRVVPGIARGDLYPKVID
jgi:hypothetical protein